jgi:hypothetical protein
MLQRMLPFVVDLERIINPSGRSNVKDGGWMLGRLAISATSQTEGASK